MSLSTKYLSNVSASMAKGGEARVMVYVGLQNAATIALTHPKGIYPVAVHHGYLGRLWSSAKASNGTSIAEILAGADVKQDG